MKYLLFIAIGLFVSLISHGQSNKPFSCDMIDSLLTNEEVIKDFHFSNIKAPKFLIVDTNNYFSNCTIPNISTSVKVEMVHGLTDSIFHNTYFMEIQDVFNFFTTYIIKFEYAPRGIIGMIEYSNDSDGFKVKRVKIIYH